MHSGHAYLEFDKLATKIHQTLKVRGVAGFGFSSEDVQERIVQRANEVLLVPFVNSFQATRCNESTGSPARSLSIDGLQFSVDILSGRLAFNARQKLKCWKEFLLGWLKVLIYSLPGRGCRLTGKNTGRVCLLYGVGKENIVVEGNDSRFAAFLASTAVSPIRDARLIVVESNERLISTAPGRIQYARDPLLEVWRLSRPKGIGFLRFAFSHCMMPIALLRESFRTPELMAISRDAAYLHLIECMQKNRLIESVVYTSSNFLAQPLWLRGFRNFSTHMVHYSQAWQVFDYQEDSRHSEYPQMRWVRFDEHWVWTKGFATYLADRDRNATIHVVGPIVWHQPIALRTPHEGIVIAAFDVPALTAAAARSRGELTNFWKAENLQAFIEDLVKLRNSCKKEIGFLSG